MSSLPKSPKPDSNRMSQQQAAFLIGRPAVWLRDNPHIGGRNSDGTYDAPKLVQAMLAAATPAEPIEQDLEPVLQFVDTITYEWATAQAAVALERVVDQFGGAGLALIGSELLRATKEHSRRSHNAGAPREQPAVLVCVYCEKHRWGRKWKKSRPPAGCKRAAYVCPDCEGR